MSEGRFRNKHADGKSDSREKGTGKKGAIKKSLEENWGYFGLCGLPAGDGNERTISGTIAQQQVE